MTVTTLQGRRRLDLIEHVTTRHPRAAMTEAQGLELIAAATVATSVTVISNMGSLFMNPI